MRDRLAKTAITALSALLICLLVMYGALSEAANRDRRALNAVYQRAFYETCELMSGLQGNLKKLSVTADAAQRQEILGDIARQAQGTQSNLAMLPAGSYPVAATMKFVNQIGDYAQALSRTLARGDELSEQDKSQLTGLSASATQFALRLDDMLTRYNEGRLEFQDYDFAFAGEEAAAPLSSPASDYPVLLYDGPFSDSVKPGQMKGLPAETVSEAEAETALREFLGAEITDLVSLGETKGEVPSWEFSFRKNGYALTAGVARQGGKVLWMLPENPGIEVRLGVEECLVNALRFLEIRGFGEMQANDYRIYEGVITVSLAPVEADVVLYPDLIKVQVSMREGEVIGMEASSYYRNHQDRDLPLPALGAKEAAARLPAELTLRSTQLALIPRGLTEKLCWEVRASRGEDEYIVYIDAQTGAEHAVYEVVRTPEGMLTQ